MSRNGTCYRMEKSSKKKWLKTDFIKSAKRTLIGYFKNCDLKLQFDQIKKPNYMVNTRTFSICVLSGSRSAVSQLYVANYQWPPTSSAKCR